MRENGREREGGDNLFTIPQEMSGSHDGEMRSTTWEDLGIDILVNWWNQEMLGQDDHPQVSLVQGRKMRL